MGNNYSSDTLYSEETYIFESAISSTRLPSRQNDGLASKHHESWEEMNRRAKMDRYFENSTPTTVQQLQDLNAEKSTEERRRLQWDLDWESQSKAIVSANSTNADPTALSTPIPSEEPTTASKTHHGRTSKSGRGLAKLCKFLMKPWAKARKIF